MGMLDLLLGDPDGKGKRRRKKNGELIPSDPAAPPEAEPDEPPPCAVRFDEERVFWAMRDLPIKEAVKHFAVCGCIGSGKTVTIDLLLHSIAQRFQVHRKQPEQLVVFDAKGDILPKLDGMGLKFAAGNIWVLNPFDIRSAVWNLAEAIDRPAMARYFASLLVPEEKNSNAPFFHLAAQQLVFSVLRSLHKIKPGTWTLRDLLCSLETKERIAAIAERDPRARAAAASILGDERHCLGVLSSLSVRIARFEEVAALWHTNKNGKKFSIPEFLGRPGVLVLGHDPVLKESLWPINAIILKALTMEILRRAEESRPRYWFVLDEFRAMENVECIIDLLNLGRSKGVSVTIGTQSIDGLIAIYREEGAHAILEQCAYKTFLRAGGPKTAEWMENSINKQRELETVKTETRGPTGSSTSTQYTWQDRSILNAGFFLSLPMPNVSGEFVGVHDLPALNRFSITRRPFDTVLSWRKPPGKEKGLERRESVEEQEFKGWDEAEERTFFGQISHSTETDPSPSTNPDPPKTPSPPAPPPSPGKDILRDHPDEGDDASNGSF